VRSRHLQVVVAAFSLVIIGSGTALAQSSAPESSAPSQVPGSASPVVSGSPALPTAPAYAWTKLAAPAGDESALILDVAAAPAGDFVALAQESLNGGAGRSWRSPDGMALTRAIVSKSAAPRILVADGDTLLAFAGNKIFRSADGTTWKPVKNKLGKATLAAVAATPEGLLGAGSKEPYDTASYVFASTDGKKWTRTQLPGDVADVSTSQIAVSDAGAAAIAGQARSGAPILWGSADGKEWQLVPFPAQAETEGQLIETVGLAATPSGLLLAVAHDQARTTFWASTDGVTWTQVSEVDGGVRALGSFPVDPETGTGGGLIAAATDRVLTSPDGVTWTDIAVPELAGDTIQAVTGTGDGRIAVAGYGRDESGMPAASSVTVGTPTAP
jgi:hypothetical protein